MEAMSGAVGRVGRENTPLTVVTVGEAQVSSGERSTLVCERANFVPLFTRMVCSH